MKKNKIPILVLAFNRPDCVRRAMETVCRYQPDRLYLACDGARNNVDGEREQVATTQKVMVDVIDWDCEVNKMFRENNLGCAQAVYEAISWFLKNEEYGIIIEDDVIVSVDFFKMCEDLLPKYANEVNIQQIDAFHPVGGLKESNTYSFTKRPMVWGWATWRRAWNNNMDMNMTQWPTFRLRELIKYYGPIRAMYMWRTWQTVYKHPAQSHSWATRWHFAAFANNLISICPLVNLSKNIGNTTNGTHYQEGDKDPYERLEIGEMRFPLKYPDKIEIDMEQVKSDNKDFWRVRYKGLQSKIYTYMRESYSCEILLFLLAFIVSFLLNRHINLFGDDFITFEQIRNYGMSELIYNLKFDAHPPLFYIFLKLYSYIAGTSILALKFFNVICYTILVIASYYIGKRIGGRRYAIVSSLTFFLFPCMYNNPVLFLRMYLLGALFIMLATSFAYLVYKTPTTYNKAAFVFCSLCACFTHYYGTLFMALVHVFLYVSLIHRDWRAWKECAIYAALPISFFIFWLPVFLNQVTLKVDSIGDETPFISRLIKSLIYPFYTGTHLPGQSVCVYLLSIFLLLLSAFVIWKFIWEIRQGRLQIEIIEKNSLMVSIAVPLFIMLILIVIGGLTKPIWFGAYITLFFPLMALGMGYILIKLNNEKIYGIWFTALSICFVQKIVLQYKMCQDTGFENYAALYDEGIIKSTDVIIEANGCSSIYLPQIRQYRKIVELPPNWYRFQFDHINVVSDYQEVLKENDRIVSTTELTIDILPNISNYHLENAYHFTTSYFTNNHMSLYIYKTND